MTTSNIECKPYEAIISKAVCDARKKLAVNGDGLTNRKCLECPAGEEIKMEERLSPKCKVCGSTEEKRFRKTLEECGKCYDKRWKAESIVKQAEALVSAIKPAPVTSPVTLPATPAKIATVPPPVEKIKVNGHILPLDFKDYPDWYEKLKELAEKELRTPGNLVMYWIKDYVR